MTARGTVKNGLVVLEPGVALPEGTSVTVTTVDEAAAAEQPVGVGPKAGTAKGKVWMADDFDQPLPDFAEYME